MRIVRFATMLAVVGLLGAGCAGGGWQQMKTRRITGYADTPRDFRDTMEQLEYAYSALSTFFPKAEVGTVEVLFLTGEDFLHTFGAERWGLAMPTLPGGGRIGRQNLIVMRQDVAYTTSTALMTHLFLHKVVANAPLWLHDGLSMYFTRATIQSGEGQWRACFGLRAPLETRYIKLPLEKFFRIGWKDYASSEPGYFRGTGVLLMDYVFHGDNGAHLSKLPNIFAAVARGTPGPEIMAATFPGMNLEQLGQRIYDFKASQSEQRQRDVMCPLPVPIPADRIPDESSPQESPISPQEIEQVMQALKQLPQGDFLPAWYPPELLGVASPAAGG